MLALGHRLTDDDLVFSDASGEPLWGRDVTTLQLKALLRPAELAAIRFHDLRHTFATLHLAAGTNPKDESGCSATRRSRSPSTDTATPWLDHPGARLGNVAELDARPRLHRPHRLVLWPPSEARGAPSGAGH